MLCTSYAYCIRYSAAALLAILFALPFAWRVLEHRDLGRWENFVLAFYHAHLELFLGNGCLGVGVLMLLALTLERYASVCHPGHARPLLGPPNRAVVLIALATFLLYLPAVFRSRVITCAIYPLGSYLYQRQDVPAIVEHPLFKIYTIVLELVFKVVPIILLAVLNLRILLVYRKSCERRRRMTLSRTASGDEDPRKFAEERRLMLLLGSTSILFLVCVSPMVILNVTLSEVNLTRYPYQIVLLISDSQTVKMDTSASGLKKWALVVGYICRVRFPQYPPYCFPFYMLILYNQIRKLNQKFKIVSVPSELIQKLIYLYGLPSSDDCNNCIIVSERYLEECRVSYKFVKVTNRFAYVIGANLKNDLQLLLVSDTFYFNLKQQSAHLKFVSSSLIPSINEINLSLINIHNDLSNGVVDTLIKNYFKTPKIVRVNDLISINFRRYAPQFYYTSIKYSGLKTVYFKCNKLFFNQELVSCGLCVLENTDIKQSPNVQGYIAPILKSVVECDLHNCDNYDRWLIDRCPYGLKKYMEDLERSVRPFMKKNKVRLRPTFLIQGHKGSGKSVIVTSLAAKLGFHLFETTSGDITASVYAQTETKIRNLFFKARLCAPCILFINNFENFSKNNEGVHDDRIISFFGAELESLFESNAFPLILICSSNTKNVPATLSRQFLEEFEIAPLDGPQRCETLQWIIDCKNVNNKAVLEEVADKTRGFVFEDLRALVYYAQKNCLDGERSVLQQDDFDSGLDLMQSRYSQSLGVPKIQKVQWSDVGGLSDVKREIVKTINLPLQHPELLRNIGLKRTGILLYGPPGTGKTLIAKAVATECNLCFLSVKGPELLNMYVGQSEQNIRDVFERAREASPCIIFFDELDSLAPNRGISGDSGGVMDRVVSQLLAEMDGLNQTATIFIIGATNRPDLIDPALLRPGRFDKLLYVGACTDAESQLSVLKALTRKFKLDSAVSLEEVIKICPKNVTGADFYGLCSVAWLSAVRRLVATNTHEMVLRLTSDDVVVGTEDFVVAARDLKPSVKPEDMAYFESVQKQYSGEIKMQK
ncbi:hypothetical protein FQA39_LY11478 [Lamprigera yunnana]|nr:hypothetical protein FQA39_LY11478 [Lamprigera yunnana]